MICLGSALIGQKHIAHENDGRMGNQGIKVTALDFFGQFQMLFGHFEEYFDTPLCQDRCRMPMTGFV
jgi:hypothetical protein